MNTSKYAVVEAVLLEVMWWFYVVQLFGSNVVMVCIVTCMYTYYVCIDVME